MKNNFEKLAVKWFNTLDEKTQKSLLYLDKSENMSDDHIRRNVNWISRIFMDKNTNNISGFTIIDKIKHYIQNPDVITYRQISSNRIIEDSTNEKGEQIFIIEQQLDSNAYHGFGIFSRKVDDKIIFDFVFMLLNDYRNPTIEYFVENVYSLKDFLYLYRYMESKYSLMYNGIQIERNKGSLTKMMYNNVEFETNLHCLNYTRTVESLMYFSEFRKNVYKVFETSNSIPTEESVREFYENYSKSVINFLKVEKDKFKTLQRIQINDVIYLIKNELLDTHGSFYSKINFEIVKILCKLNYEMDAE